MASVLRVAGGYSIALSLVLLAALLLRPEASVNWLNALTLVLASLSGYLAVRYPADGLRLGLACLLLLAAVTPTIFGFIVFLYLPAVLVLTLGLLRLLARRATWQH